MNKVSSEQGRTRRIVFAWELGDNLGHLWRLVPIAQELVKRGHTVHFALRDMATAQRVLAPRKLDFIACPTPARLTELGRDLVSYADILAIHGCGDAAQFDGMTTAWKNIYALLGTDLVVTEHAPVALASARMAGLATVNLGTGFTIPPNVSPMPCFRSGTKVTPETALQTEQQVLARLNQALAAHGRPTASTLYAALDADVHLLLTLPELDHYGKCNRTGQRYVGPVANEDSGMRVAWRQTELPRVFLYLRNSAALPVALEAVASRPVEAIAVVSDIPAGLHARFRDHPRLRIFTAPVQLSPLLPDCALAVTAAGHGTALDCLINGVPMLLLPNHIEQLMVSAQVASRGLVLGIIPEAVGAQFGRVFDTLINDPAWRARARAAAQPYQEIDTVRILDDVVTTIESTTAGSA